MSHRILYIEKCEYLHLYLDNLKVQIADSDILFPIKDIQILVIDNYKSTMSVSLLNKLTENNVCTILCGIDHLPKSYILPMNGNFSQSGNINKQIRWDKEKKSLAHQRIVQAKIKNQIEILKQNNKENQVIQKLFQYQEEVQSKDSTNREGLAAKIYFRELFGSDFIRFENDVINAGLYYGYSIFRSLITSIIVAKGYLPNIGIFHIGKLNMFNLSDDIIEVFRPIVDDYVYNHMTEDILFKQQHRESLIALTNKKVYIDGRKQTIANAMYEYIESVLKILEDNNTLLKSPLPIVYDL